MGNRISVLQLGSKDKIFSNNNPQWEETEFDCSYVFNYFKVNDYDVILTVGDSCEQFKEIYQLNYEVRKKWIHVQKVDDLTGTLVMDCYVGNLQRPNVQPLVSVFTPTYKTGDKLSRPFNSLRKQTYDNWEWVCFDDSPDNKTFNQINELSKKEHRISLYKSNKNCGNIGEMKYRACALAKGDILVELDHDDELMSNALELIVDAFKKYPEAGFAYTDWAELFDNGIPALYGNGFAFGYGSYRKEIHNGYGELNVCQSLNINPKTVRHLVGLPNHIRAWKRDLYNEIGGYSRNCIVADDYELLLRTFLHTKMIKIPKLGYIQYYQTKGIKNTQDYRRREIQRHMNFILRKYDNEIHNRFEELGIEDWVWENGRSNLNIMSKMDSDFVNIIY